MRILQYSIGILLLILLFNLTSQAQTDLLLDFNQERLVQQRTGMYVLGGWAVSNIALGASLYSSHQGSERYFHLMNAGWNVVNLGIAAIGYYGVSKIDPASLSVFESFSEHQKFQKILLFNAGLDVGYMLGGLYLMERAKNDTKNPDRLKGFGKSIILQGAFLFTFDLAMYFIQAADNPKLEPLLSTIYFNGSGVGLVINF